MKQHVKDISQEEFIAFQHGDPGVFRIIFDTYQDTLYRFAYSLCNDRFMAEEAVQESFVVLHQKKMDIDAANGIYPFLFVVVKRYLIKSFRKAVIRARYKHELTHSWAEHANSAEEHIQGRDLLSLLHDLVDQLPDGQRKIFQLNKFAGYSCDEISRDMDISKNTVKNQLVTASKKIRLKLSKVYFSIF